MKKIFFDTEFTGIHKNTTLISIGIVSDCGKSFYAEFTDYDKSQIDDFLTKNVLPKLHLEEKFSSKLGGDILQVKGSKQEIKKHLEEWLIKFEKVQMVADVLAYDWVLFCDIFGTAFDVPKNIHYIPIDISTIFYQRGIDVDIDRHKYIGVSDKLKNLFSHNSLSDAHLTKECYIKLSYGQSF